MGFGFVLVRPVYVLKATFPWSCFFQDKVEVEVARKEKGKVKNKKLKAKAILVEKNKKYLIEFSEKATEEQIQLRNAWLGQK